MRYTMSDMFQSSATVFQCGMFSGKGGQSATQWLKRLEWKMKKCSDGKEIDLINLLQTVNFLLVKDAVIWVESAAVEELLKSSASTADTVAQFTTLFTQRFLSKIQDVPAVHFNTEIADLHQQEEETLLIYYQ